MRFLLAGLCVTLAATAFADVPYGTNDSAGNFASVNGIRLYYEMYGEGPPLLLVHGHRGSISSFAALIPLLAPHFKVIAADSRAQGRSTDGAEPITYALIASDLAALLDQLAIPHAQLAVVPGSSHLFPIEKPDLTAQLISRFLTSPYYDVDAYYFLRP